MKSPPATSHQIGKRLRSVIEKSGLTILEIARRSRVTRFYIYDILTGKTANPSAVRLARLAKALGVPLVWLIGSPANGASSVRGGNKRLQPMPSDPCVRLTKGDKLRPLDEVLQDIFEHAIAFCDGNKTHAADGLGMSRSTFYRQIGAQREFLSQKQEL